MVIAIDVQGFKTSPTTFTPKELAVFNGHQVAHIVFKPPFSFSSLDVNYQRQAIWLMHNHHCIKWEEGHTPPHLFPIILRRLVSPMEAIYVKGKEKAEFIRKTLSQDVVEINEEPALPKLEASCLYHSYPKCHCALANVYYIHNNYTMS
uniref:Uncharacterized protein n=1 Tax=Photinus pyralis TaxID=7054 RepID=A0A1Y1MVY2_PHOPY